MSVNAGTATPKPTLPSLGTQKTVIIANYAVLDKSTREQILALVMMEQCQNAVHEAGQAKEVNIDLDAVEQTNSEVITHIYNLVSARLNALRQPAKASN